MASFSPMEMVPEVSPEKSVAASKTCSQATSHEVVTFPSDSRGTKSSYSTVWAEDAKANHPGGNPGENWYFLW